MKKTFKWLNVSQFTGAFNDNAFKMTAIIGLVNLMGETQKETVIATCSILFVLPFLLFSNAAGTLADRISKRTVIIVTKWLEIALLVLAIPSVLSGASLPLYALLFLLCAQSALFGPSKRGIVPELVEAPELSRANGFLTASTYAAIILGTATPALLIGYLGYSALWVIALCTVFAVIGTLAAYRIAHVKAAGTTKKSSVLIIPDVIRAVRNLKEDTWARLAVLGLVLFGAVSALFQQTLIIYGQQALNLSLDRSPILFPLAAVGIGLGALLSGKMSRHTIEVGLIPVGAIGIAFAATALAFAAHPAWIAGWIVILGVCCGIYLVPLNAFLQHRIPAERRGEVFGASGFLSFTAMIAASGLFALMTKVFHFNARHCVFATALLALVPAAIACRKLSSSLVRFCLSRLVKRLYKVRFSGTENLPREGGALLICNHTAYADALLLQAATSRPVRFVMSRDVFKTWKWAKPIFTLTDCIPIHTSDGPRALANSLKEARQAMEDGAIVAVFPEGKLTRNGNLMQFNKGFEKIARNSNCPIIPAHIGNIWGSIFSFYKGRPGLKFPFKLRYPVSVRFGAPLPSCTGADEARRVIAELGAEYASEKSRLPGNTLPHCFIHQARRRWFRPIASDTLGNKASYGKLLTGSVALANRIKPNISNQKNIGIYMPTSLGGVLANLAVTLSGKTSINLNWTASSEALSSATKQARIKYVLTSRRFMQKIQKPDLPVRWLYIEDELKNLGHIERLRAICAALFGSPKHLAGNREPQPDDIATIIFSSGTTGAPKGVMLSHANILSNVDGTQAVQHFSPRDSMCAILPLFHAFGYLGLMWWPLLKGIRVAYHPNPLQTERVIRLIREEKLTALLSTPTFLQGYMRKAKSEDFASLKHIITGGEKLRPELADRFEEQFDIRPLEGYGCTELSPVALLSLKNSYRAGSAGQPLPGTAVRIVDPETRIALNDGEEGLMLIKGPNVMQGYLNQPEKTAEVLQDGWYNTGDMARMDKHGYVFITGRISRFSKIGGEMVPHGAIEDALQQAAGTDSPCVAVVSIDDAAKGEQLAVCYTAQAGDPAELIAKLRAIGLPNLWIPRIANFFSIPEIPILGTGKLDLYSIQKMVQFA
ncbi:MAG: MFS transporter [Pontiellaceae bacterium]|nr:MFS transporter [Pontiellaceae bacterium]MBN2785377.1 MFS transporter [Pontiellaceae bacterium]